MRVASHSKDDTRRAMNMKSLSNAFIDLKDSNNSIVRTAVYEKPMKSYYNEEKEGVFTKLFGKNSKPKSKRLSFSEWLWKCVYEETSNHKVTPVSLLDIDYNILCDKELGKLQMLPTAKIQRKFEDKMESLRKTENSIPEVFRDESGIPLGIAEHKGQTYKIYLPDKNPDEYHLPIIGAGIQGSGKDTFAINFVYENAMRGRGSVVLDVIDEKDRGMADMLCKCLPEDKLVVLDFSDEEYVPYLDWAEGMSGGDSRFDRSKFASELVKFFEAEDEAGMQTERYLKEASKAMRGESVLRIGLMLISPELRKERIKYLKEQGDIATAAFWEMYDKEGEGRQRQIASPILNRLHKLYGDETLKPIFGQKPTGKIDFDKWLSEGKVIICKIPKDLYTTNGIRTLVHWLTVKTWLTKQRQFRENRKVSSFLVLNEPHQFFTKGLESTLEEIFPESRKYWLGVVMLFHDLAQVDNKLFDIMESSGANFILLKQKGMKIWKRFEHKIGDFYSIEECNSIEKFEAIIGFTINRKDYVLRVKMNDMPIKRGCPEYDNGGIEKKHSKLYCRPIKEVEKEIQEDEMILAGIGRKKTKVKN